MVVIVFLSFLVKYLIIFTLTPLVYAALPFFFELVDAVVAFLHRERLHCVLVLLVKILVFVCFRR